MGDKVLLTVEERTVLGKKVAQLRKQGFVPGVLYGADVDALPVMAPAKLAEKAWHDAGKHHPIELTVGDKKRLAMIKSADLDPVKRHVRHLSFHIVKQNEKVETEVPVRVKGEGETPAEKAGLVVLQALEIVEVAALPMALPNELFVPGKKLAQPGDTLTVADILPIDGVQVMTDPSVVVASAYEPSALAAQNEAAAGDATEEAPADEAAGEEPTPEGEKQEEKK